MSSLDVVVPCYRYGRFLRLCVQSILQQPVPQLRVLILDDASPDDTSEVAAALVAEDARVSFHRHSTNQGHIKTYNEGIAWAAADYFLLLSADDYLLPDALGHSIQLLDDHPNVAFTCGRAIELWDDGRRRESKNCIAPSAAGWQILPGDRFIELCGASNCVSTPTAVVRTGLQKESGGYRTYLPHSGDMEMWLRFAAIGSVGIIDACQAAYRRHGSNMSLQYEADGGLADLVQRKAAIDSFLLTCESILPNSQTTKQLLMSSLSRAAVGAASQSFNEGRNNVSRALLQFATEVHPPVMRSVPWLKLACKQRIGIQTWNYLKPLIRHSPVKP